MKKYEKEMDAFEVFGDDPKVNEIKFAEISLQELETQYSNIVKMFDKNSIPQKLWEELQLAKNKLEMLRKEAEKEAALNEAISQLVEECHFKPVFKPASKNNLFSTDKVETRSQRIEHIGIKIDISRVSGSIDVCFANTGTLEDLLLIRFCPDRREIYFDICQTKDWQINLESKFREININFMEQAEIIYMIRLIRGTLITHGYKNCDKFGF